MSRARDNANLSPTIPDARMPNLTGDITTSEGAVATTIATDAVDIAMLSATGTASSSTFLRGDNSWQTAGGSTSASDLDSGTLAVARMAAGTVIQTQAVSSNNRETTTSSSWDTKWTSILAITPHEASSNIWLCATLQCYSSSGAAYFDFYKYASDVTATYNLSGLSYGMSEIHNDENWCSTTIIFIDPVAENSTSTKTYSISGRTGGTGTTYIGGGANAGVTLTIMEIAT